MTEAEVKERDEAESSAKRVKVRQQKEKEVTLVQAAKKSINKIHEEKPGPCYYEVKHGLTES